ncbi:hypothetical protein [Spirosoma flavum]|uniref:Uncharacterized protein n=1 Tax=Spirosoma flavum TaxID=2048557 RepID=A0ABW6AK04_9BACT
MFCREHLCPNGIAPAHRREALGIEVDYSLPAQRITRRLDRLVEQYGKLERFRSDNRWPATAARIHQSGSAGLVLG